MTLNHSKTWPVNTFAVVQLRVDSEGHIYSSISKEDEAEVEAKRSAGIHADDQTADISHLMPISPEKHQEQQEPTPRLNAAEEPIKHDDNEQVGPQENGPANISTKEKASVFPLSKKHLEMFSKVSPPPPQYRATVRTDTVSTILDQEIEFDYEATQDEEKCKSKQHDVSQVEKFHVLALTRIEETSIENECRIGRRPSIRVDNWDFIYTERLSPENVAPGRVRCPIHRYGPEPPLRRDSSEPELPLDARKSATLRKHYYLEGGWGWVIVVCSVMVNVVNHGVQLSSATLNQEGVQKFRVEPVHFAGLTVLVTLSVSIYLRNPASLASSE